MPLTLGVIAPTPTWSRPVGDAGNAESYSHEVLFHHLDGIPASAILRPVPNPELLAPYLAAARDLASRGARVIGTTCGFLSPLQAQISADIGVPFVSSALLQVPLAWAVTRRRVGIITADDTALTPAYLEAAGVTEAIPTAIVGLQTYPAFTASAVKGAKNMDQDAVRAGILEATRDLLATRPDIGSIVLECHNLPPFSPDIRAATGLPVYDVLTMMEWASSGVAA